MPAETGKSDKSHALEYHEHVLQVSDHHIAKHVHSTSAGSDVQEVSARPASRSSSLKQCTADSADFLGGLHDEGVHLREMCAYAEWQGYKNTGAAMVTPARAYCSAMLWA